MKKAIFIVIISLLCSLGVIFSSQVLFAHSGDTGELQVTSQPEAKVYLDDQYMGQTPVCRCASVNPTSVLQAKDYTLKLMPIKGDQTPFIEHITITKGVLSVVDRTFRGPAQSEGSTLLLEPLNNPDDSSVTITSFPNQTNILFDGNPIGTTPFSLQSPTESDHTLVLKKQGYNDKTLHIRTPKGYKLHAIIYLAINPSVSSQPSDTQQQASASATLTPTLSPSPTVSKITILDTPTGFLRVRSQASLGSDEIGEVKPGDTLYYIDEKPDWFEVKLPDGKIGWISSQYAQKN